MKYKFEDGLAVEGTIEQILSVAKTMGKTVRLSELGGVPHGYYLSEHNGLLKINEMNSRHIKHAIVKRTKKLMEEVVKRPDNEFLQGYGDIPTDTIIVNLVNELDSRF